MTAKEVTPIKFPAAEAFNLAGLVEYHDDAVVSRTIIKNDSGSITLFAFGADQGLSEHSGPFDALAHVVDGNAEFVIGGKARQVNSGQVVVMPANIPHAVRALSPFKMLLTMLRVRSSQDGE